MPEIQQESFFFTFDGLNAANGRLDFYDASISGYGAARVFKILGHYYSTGSIIHQAPKSNTNVFIVAPERGSFREQLIITVLAGALLVPFGRFANFVMDEWLPPENKQMETLIQELHETNRLLRQQEHLPAGPAPEETHADHALREFHREHGQNYKYYVVFWRTLYGIFFGRSVEVLLESQ